MRKTQKFVAVVAIAVTAAFSGQAAKAGHPSFCYTGACYGFAGEQQLINALEYIDAAYQANCFHPELAEAAHQQACAARELLCDRKALYEVRKGLDDLDDYLHDGELCELRYAARHFTRALEYEQRRHLASVQVRDIPGLHPRHVPAAVAPPRVHANVHVQRALSLADRILAEHRRGRVSTNVNVRVGQPHLHAVQPHESLYGGFNRVPVRSPRSLVDFYLRTR